MESSGEDTVIGLPTCRAARNTLWIKVSPVTDTGSAITKLWTLVIIIIIESRSAEHNAIHPYS